MVRMEAQWALWSERPDARADYAVLSCSDGQLRANHFNRLITRFSPGSPDSERALPRLTVGRVDIEGTPYVGLAIQKYSRHKDGVGRNIAPTSYFCLPYAALAGQPVSYLQLYEALHTIPLPESGGGPLISLDVGPFAAKRIVADIATFRADALYAAALLLTKGRRVCVTQAEHTSPEERLGFLDAVAALLPYGYRAKLTLSTWANSATLHPLRLFFARTPPEADDESDRVVTALRWEGKTEPVGPAQAEERRYFELLGQALDRYRPAELVEAFALEVEPRAFDGQAPAIEVLQRICRGLDRRSRLRQGTYTVSDLREGLDDPDLDPATSRDLLVKLMKTGGDADLTVIEKALERLPKSELSTLLAPLQEMAITLLWSPANVRLQRVVEQAARCGHADWFLRGLVTQPSLSHTELENGLNAAARLLVTNVMADPQGYPKTLGTLRQNIPVALALIVELATAEDEAGLAKGLELVRPGLPEELARPIDVAAGLRRERVDEYAFGALFAHGHSCVPAVLAIASRRRQMPFVIDGFVSWLASGGGFRPPGHDTYWSRQLDALDPEEPDVRGKLDVLLLMTGGKPSSMSQIVREQWPAYRDGFIQAWLLDWPGKARMTRGLADYLRAQRWQESPEREAEVRDLMHALFPAGEPTIFRALDASRDKSRRTEANPQVARPVVAPPPAGRPPVARLFGDGGPAGEALAVIVATCEGRGTADAACRRLVKEGKIADAATALEVVGQMVPALTSRTVAMQTAEEWQFVLVRELCTGLFGPEIARDFRHLYLRTFLRPLEEETRRLAVLNRINPVAWDDEDIAVTIDGLRQKIGELDAEAKKLGGGRRRGHGIRGKLRRGGGDHAEAKE
ncbi:MAG TPA: hypothetical protein VFU43_24125 [Streptosporangiaceae bacterium]|nr:hypothetical protein [Streptosporangiaceae bacterium]